MVKQKSNSKDFNIELAENSKSRNFNIISNVCNRKFDNGKKHFYIQSKNDPMKTYGTIEVQNLEGKVVFISFDLVNKSNLRKYRFYNTTNTLCTNNDSKIIMHSELSLTLQQIAMVVLHYFISS